MYPPCCWTTHSSRRRQWPMFSTDTDISQSSVIFGPPCIHKAKITYGPAVESILRCFMALREYKLCSLKPFLTEGASWSAGDIPESRYFERVSIVTTGLFSIPCISRAAEIHLMRITAISFDTANISTLDADRRCGIREDAVERRIHLSTTNHWVFTLSSLANAAAAACFRKACVDRACSLHYRTLKPTVFSSSV